MSTPTLKHGDIIRLGDHLLLCGDSRDADMVSTLLRNQTVSLIVTDPPYGVGYVEGKSAFTKSVGKHKPIANDQLQTDEEYRMFTQQWLEAVRPYLTRRTPRTFSGRTRCYLRFATALPMPSGGSGNC